MLSLGLSCFYHDSAVALVSEDKILFAAQEERFTRIKGDSSFPEQALKALFRECNLSLEDITHVSYYENPNLKLNRISKTFLSSLPRNLSQIANFIQHFERERYFPIHFIEAQLGKKVIFHNHHESHAASSFLTSPFDESAVLIVDGVGEWASSSIFAARRDAPILDLIKEERFPNSLGLFYATLTSYAGFKVNSGEYKFMGLAPYGQPTYVNLLKNNVIDSDDAGNIKLNMRFFGFTSRLTMWSKPMIKLLGFLPRQPEARIRQIDCDLARSVQYILEEIYVKKARHALKVTNQKNLCLAGGVALNCVANGKLREILPIENIHIVPAAGDAGGALGAALLTALKELPHSNSRSFNLNGGFLGTSYSDLEIEQALQEAGLVYDKLSKEELQNRVAEMLFNDKTVGWFSGKMEYGPRALGARSIIASAVSPNMQSRLNLQIKKRESFRPFAPIVLAEHAHEWFHWPKDASSNFMLFTALVADKYRIQRSVQDFNTSDEDIDLIKIVNKARSKIPAVTHIDNSARLQTIASDNPVHGVLSRYFRLSHVPVLVNTSFNVRNEPIVESPSEAIRCFMTTDIDILVMENFMAMKKNQTIESLNVWKSKHYIGDLD